MINLLFTIVFTEMALILTLVFRTPLRKLVMMGIDLMKQGKGPLVAKTVVATILVVFASVLNNVMQIRRRSQEAGVVSSTDEVLMAERILEASIMGFSLFLAMMIDRLHYYIKELHLVRKDLEEMQRFNQQENYDKKKILGTHVHEANST
ncbi:hypothetical protein Tsubulata_002365 [Turnera subulata]|uniref:Endoplasmic reticulum transmembrane protein n=1 Tax=Turnera subulata TaxID=218843 RepID=A0A9Q0G6C0_9ROSI|nr:hypothetical protein Tsubulata_002365 [Turnera subulata]